MKFCPECGAAVSGGKFCSECGHRLQGEVTPSAGAVAPPPAGIGFDLPDLSSFDTLGNMANNCVAQDLARQEADALAAFEVEKHQNGKYAILALRDKSEMSVVVPDSVEAIGPNAFEGSDVMTVTLPEGLLKIGDRAFADCVDLESINFPKSLRVIGDEAFAGCVNLDVEPPEGVRIGEDAFKDNAPEQRRKEAERKVMQEEKRIKELRDKGIYQIGDTIDLVLVDDKRQHIELTEIFGEADSFTLKFKGTCKAQGVLSLYTHSLEIDEQKLTERPYIFTDERDNHWDHADYVWRLSLEKCKGNIKPKGENKLLVGINYQNAFSQYQGWVYFYITVNFEENTVSAQLKGKPIEF